MFEVAPPRPCSAAPARGLPPQIGRSAASGGDPSWGIAARRALPVAVLVVLAAGCGSRTGTLEPVPRGQSVADGSADSAGAEVSTEPKGGWISAADSTFKLFDLDGTCLADRGCPFDPTPIPTCPEDTNSVPLHEVLASAKTYAGRTVVVSAQIWFHRTQDSHVMGCSDACCDFYVGKLFLKLTPDAAPLDMAGLQDPQWHDAFIGKGDRTANCLGIDARDGQVVTVSAQLKHLPEITSTLVRPRLCTPEQESD